MIPVSKQHRSPIVQKVTAATGKIKVFSSNVTHASQTDIFFFFICYYFQLIYSKHNREQSLHHSHRSDRLRRKLQDIWDGFKFLRYRRNEIANKKKRKEEKISPKII